MINNPSRYKNLKLYFVRFISKSTGKTSFYKIGYTHHFDALKRFKGAEYSSWEVKVIVSAYGPTEKVLAAEQELLTRFPKNLWIEEKISGVTEILYPSGVQYQSIYDYIKEKSHIWYNERHSIPIGE